MASEPEALVAFLRRLGLTVVRVGLEAGPLSQWLYDGLHKADFEAVLLETRHVIAQAALSAMAIKTDRRDAHGIAQLLRMGWYRPVHRKSVPLQEVRALLAARKQMQIKAIDLEQTVRGLLRGFGLQASSARSSAGRWTSPSGVACEGRRWRWCVSWPLSRRPRTEARNLRLDAL